MKTRFQLPIALLLILSGVIAAAVIMNTSPQTAQYEEIAAPPVVHIVTVQPQRLRMEVRSQGRVAAQTEIDLVSGVSGNIVKVAPAFVSGGFFNQGDLLIAIDPAEYDLRIAQAQARVMEAQYQLTREEAEAEQARDEWQQLGQGDPGPLNLRIPQLREKRAKLAAEQEELKNARLLRQRTEIRAPFSGRVRSKNVGLGQFIHSGAILGRIYSSDLAEVRLPLTTGEFALIGFWDLAQFAQPIPDVPVQLTADYQGRWHTWPARLVRSEGVVDPDTGMIAAVAQVQDPFALQANKKDAVAAVPLPVGLFVEAVIAGRWLEDLIVIPVSAVFSGQRVVIVDDGNRLRFRNVEILKIEREQVIVAAGLTAGERVLVSGLLHPVEGMAVTPVDQMP